MNERDLKSSSKAVILHHVSMDLADGGVFTNILAPGYSSVAAKVFPSNQLRGQEVAGAYVVKTSEGKMTFHATPSAALSAGEAWVKRQVRKIRKGGK